MALPKYALGREEKAFVVPETTYGAAASAPAAGNAIRFKTLSISEKEDRVQRDDKRSTRSYLATVVRRISLEWSISGYLLPSGALGTAPDGWDDLIEAAMGTETVNGGASVVYTLAKEFEKTVTIHRGVGAAAASDIFSEMARGCVVNKMTINLSGADEAMITMSGFGSDVLRAGTSLVVTDSGTSVVVTAGEGAQFDAGAYIDIDAAPDVLISSISTDTLTTVSHTAQTALDVISPTACNKSQTFAAGAIPISGILGSASWAGSTLEIVSAVIDLDNGAKAHNDKYGANKTTSFHEGNRKVTGSITFRLHEDNFLTIAKTKNATTIALSLVAGTTAGSICTIACPAIIPDYTAIPSTPVDDIMVTIPFIAYGSSGEDELSVTFT